MEEYEVKIEHRKVLTIFINAKNKKEAVKEARKTEIEDFGKEKEDFIISDVSKV